MSTHEETESVAEKVSELVRGEGDDRDPQFHQRLAQQEVGADDVMHRTAPHPGQPHAVSHDGRHESLWQRQMRHMAQTLKSDTVRVEASDNWRGYTYTWTATAAQPTTPLPPWRFINANRLRSRLLLIPGGSANGLISLANSEEVATDPSTLQLSVTSPPIELRTMSPVFGIIIPKNVGDTVTISVIEETYYNAKV